MRKLMLTLGVVLAMWTVPFLWADTVILNSGMKIEGEILSDTDGVIRIKTSNVAGTIFRTMELQRSDVREVQRSSSEELAQKAQEADYKKLQRYQLAEGSYVAGYYDQVINGVLGAFLQKYPMSSHASAVKSSIQEWMAERDRVVRGGIKLRGQWYEGEAARKVQGEMEVTRLIAEGDDLVVRRKYEEGIERYKGALTQAAPSVDTIDAIGRKVDVAYKSWIGMLSSAGVVNPASEITVRQSTIQKLQADIAQKSQEVARLQAEANRIESTRWNRTRGHWIASDGTNYGAVRPDTTSLRWKARITQGLIDQARSKIAENEAAIADVQSRASDVPSQIQNVQAAQAKFIASLASARSTAVATLKPVMADTSVSVQELSIGVTQPVYAVTNAVSPSATSTQPALNPSEVSQSSRAESAAAVEHSDSWWDKHWKIIFWSATGVVALFVLFRR